MNIYVGNMSTDVTEDELREAFGAFGEVASVNIVKDKISGESRGFGFVTMPTTNEGKAAIEQMNGKDFKGQTLTVEEGRARTTPPPRGGGGRRRY